MAKAPTKKAKAKKGFEDTLWDTANQLRGSVESSEYKHVVLSLVFLKFISDKFEARRQKMKDEGQGDFLEMEVFYQQDNIFYLPEEARWSFIKQHAKQDNIAVLIDTALSTIEKRNPTLKGALPDNYFSRQNLETKKLASLIDTIDNIETLAHETDVEALSKEDLVGRVYEYFLGKFAATEGKGGGEFYTPKCVVTLLTEMLEPFQGKIYDPCCGSAGMFVQSVKFVESHQGKSRDIALYGQELTATTYKLAKMNLAIRGLSANLGERPADTFFSDQHPDLKADYILANPPFNLKDWRNDAELTKDPRFAGYRTPPTGNANYGWILHMLSKLSANGTAGFVLANGSMSSNTSGEGEIRAQMIENDLIDCMIALPGQLFFTTQIPVCLWFMTKSKASDPAKGYRNRRGETLFIDARNLGTMINRTIKELTSDDIATIADTYHAWRSTPEELAERIKRGDSKLAQYEDQAGFCKVATIAEIKANDYVLTPGRYVGAAEQEDDGVAFETKMRELSKTLFAQMKQAEELDNTIRQNLEALGYGF
ncbi:type I restriction-modification system subunit M [Raoultella ornithinolytica]|jgi:type I restriction enzyme M protein|uniref:type I restriction-modification system subunit M n=1 Tax=Raoultella ornithinolytica TaxID=54291 RepID=UPI000BE35636|nr:class I SAM-dependent DNA methyltransferase [Raoultella ornithinolytica]ELS1888541.1 type I restriction-modification system subunit M [Raoultella ornithinolytica]MCF6669420.1 type I restriction-modification system subunit M [Raoultella ornithinolytica]MEB7863306.1 type I restriction-modification system subunit M [Raoultella ornithinolytica]MEB7984302.1 type I restriction-modification system subunit M [Raoultella ornithinolytica]PJF15613.1 DNA methyltransferase [Raoultella ornithinolytica]